MSFESILKASSTLSRKYHINGRLLALVDFTITTFPIGASHEVIPIGGIVEACIVLAGTSSGENGANGYG